MRTGFIKREVNKVASNNEFSWKTVIIMLIFLILSSLGGAFAIQNKLNGNHSAVVSVGYAAAAGIFIVVAIVVLMQVLSAFKEK